MPLVVAATSGRPSKDYTPRHAQKKARGAGSAASGGRSAGRGRGATGTRSRSPARRSSTAKTSATASGGRGATKRSGPKGPRKGFFRRYWWAFALTPVALGLLGVGVLALAYARIDLPKALPPIQTTFVYDRNGDLLSTFHGSVDRTIIPLRKMPQHLRDAVIAVEDARFYDHAGVDLKGTIRAAWTDLVAGDTVQGGSTITQQLGKRVYAGHYTAPGENGIRAYGIEAAARTYFGVRARRLTLLDSATLAGILTAPEAYDPIDHPFDAKFRRDFALDRMVRYGYLDEGPAERLKRKACCGIPLSELDGQAARIEAPGDAEYFVQYVKEALSGRYGSAEVFGGGLQVTTTLDLDLQGAAEAAIEAHLPSPEDPGAALVAIEPATGQILAMVGGRDFATSQLN